MYKHCCLQFMHSLQVLISDAAGVLPRQTRSGLELARLPCSKLKLLRPTSTRRQRHRDVRTVRLIRWVPRHSEAAVIGTEYAAFSVSEAQLRLSLEPATFIVGGSR